MSDILEIRVKKSHVAVLSVVVLVASASAAVNVRDPMNVFGDLKIAGGEVSAEDQNQNPANITLTSPINMQNNNIYNIGNIGNLNGGTGGGGLTVPPYNDISSQRQTGSTYTNNHNGPRLVTVIMNTAGEIISDRRLRAFVNGKNVQAYGSGDAKASGFYTVSFFVPQGANYRVTGNYANIIWYEQDLQGGGGGSGDSLSMPKGSFSCAGPEGCGSNPVKTFDPANGYLVSAQIEMAGTDGVGSFDSTSIRLNYVDGSSSTYKVSDDLSARSKKIHAYNTPNKKVDTIDVLVDAGSGDFYTSDHSVKWALVSGGTGEDGQTGGGGGLGDGTGLEWYKSSTTNEDYSDDKTFSFGCPSGENLVAYHGATSGQADTPPPWYGSWLGPIDTSGNNIDYDHAGYVNHHIAGRVMGINSSDTDSLSVSIRMDPVAPGYDKTFATINVGCLPGQ